MQNESTYRKFSVENGNGARLPKRTPVQKRILRERAQRHQQEVIVALSDFLPRPLSYAWEDGRIGKQRFWGNLLRHAEEVVDSPEPPPFAVMFRMAEVLAWHLIDLYQDRGLPTELPDPDPRTEEAGQEARAGRSEQVLQLSQLRTDAMSWNASYPSYDAFDNDYPSSATPVVDDATGEQRETARRAARAIIESGHVGLGVDYVVNLSGHANAGHAPREGWANDCITVSVTQKSPKTPSEAKS